MSHSSVQSVANVLVSGALYLTLVAAPSLGQTANPVAATSVALRNGDFAGALRISSAALQRTPHDVRLLTLQGVAYSGEKRPALALKSFEAALALSPDFLPALEGAAQVAYQQGGGAAKPLLTRILVEHPTDPTANAMLGVVDYRLEDCAGAVEHFEKARALLPSQPGAVEQYGVCLASLNRFEDATTILQQAVNLDPTNAVAVYNLALAEWNAGKIDEALESVNTLLSASQVPEDVLTLAADIYESKNDTQDSVEVLRRAILTHPKDKRAYLQFANLSFKHNSVQVGIDMVNFGLTQLPKEAELYLVRGVLLSQTSNSTKALEDFDTAVQLDPALSFAGIARGLAKSQAHDDAAALASFKSAARLHPDDGLTQYLLAEALSEAAPAPGTSSFAEELAAAKRSILLNPRRIEAHDLLASLYLTSGQTELSIQQSEAALEIDPDDDVALYHEILALRKGDERSAVPSLVQRMMKIREGRTTERKPKLSILVEVPPTPDRKQQE